MVRSRVVRGRNDNQITRSTHCSTTLRQQVWPLYWGLRRAIWLRWTSMSSLFTNDGATYTPSWLRSSRRLKPHGQVDTYSHAVRALARYGFLVSVSSVAGAGS